MNPPDNTSITELVVPRLDFSNVLGPLVAIEGVKEILPDLARIFFITSESKPLNRGGHAHRECRQLLFCVKGSVALRLKKGKKIQVDIKLGEKENALIEPWTWVTITMAPYSIVMVLCDLPFEETDYIRNWNEYILELGQECEF